MLNAQAPAKLNLSLEVVGRRPDGYHELITVMQTVSLFDVLTFGEVPGFHLSSSDASMQAGNLAEKAARALAEACDIELNASITLEKYIPAAAGLGGGSSDAATTLLALNDFWELHLSCDELRVLAEKVGSDVPFFLYQGAALVEGRGDRVTTLSKAGSTWYLLVNPGFQVSTGDVFAELSENEWTDGKEARDLARRIEEGASLRVGPNDLQEALFRISPQAREFVQRLREAIGSDVLISGSGPTAFAVFSSQDGANEAADRMKNIGYRHDVVTDFVPLEGTMPCA